MQRTLPNHYITKIQPKEYLVQGMVHCGVYSIKALLSAYGKDNKKRPEEYHTFWLSKLTGTVFQSQYLIDILNSYGLKSNARTAQHLSNSKKITVLKSLLAKNKPVLISIGNGYLKNGEYSSIKAKLIGHIITIWGYDDKDQVFYVYDSCVKKENYDRNIPIGNKKRSYKELIRDWKGALLSNIFDRKYFYLELLN